MRTNTYSFLPIDVGFDLRHSGDLIDLPREEPLQISYLEGSTPVNFMGTRTKAAALLQLAGYRVKLRPGLEETRVQINTCAERLDRGIQARDAGSLEFLSVMFSKFADEVKGALWKPSVKEEALTLAYRLQALSDQALAASKEASKA